MALIPLRDGTHLHARIVGRGQPVLMLHGMGMDSRHWLPFVLPHAHRHRFVMPDFRGAGGSRHVRLRDPDLFQNLAEDVEDLIAHLRLEDFLLVGYSLGASTALHLLRHRGFEGVARYLHIDQSPCVGNRDDWAHGLRGRHQDELFDVLRALDAILEANPGADFLDELPRASRREVARLLSQILVPVLGESGLEHVIPRFGRHAPEAFLRVFPLSYIPDLRTTLRAYLAGGHDYREALRDVETPTTVFVGMRSPLYPPEGQMRIAELVRRGRVVRFEGSGHVLVLDEPRKFHRELGVFLRGE